jgi:hypothetical protein
LLYKSTILYGNSGGTGALTFINASFKNLRLEDVVDTTGVSKEPLGTVTNPAAFDALSTVVTDPLTNEHFVPVLVFIPPDNPACAGSGGTGGDSLGSGGGSTASDESTTETPAPGSFNVMVRVRGARGGGSGGGGGGGGTGGGGTGGGGTGGGGTGGGGTGGGGTGGGGGDDEGGFGPNPPGGGGGSGGQTNPPGGCDPDFIADNDVVASAVDTSQIGSCFQSLPGSAKDALLATLVDQLIGALKSKIPHIDDFERLQACYNSFAAAHAAVTTHSPQAIAAAAQQVLSCAGVDSVPTPIIFELAFNLAKNFVDQLKDGPCGDRNKTKFVFSCDPNDKVGSTGVGAAGFISGDVPIPYAVFFENKPAASVPAQDVVITDQLDLSKLNVASFELGAISFGDKTVLPPSGRSEFNTEVDLRPATNLLVRINAKLEKTTGLLTWRFASIDPLTLQPTLDPLAGFLPPNRATGVGQGSVLFTVSPKPNLASGTPINNGARVFFDSNAPIDTPVWLNTIDNAKPSSSVQPLPATVNTESFTVQWSGTDADSGIANLSIFVSENGGPFELWLRNTSAASAVYQGRQGKSYGFFSTARDNTGNVESVRTTAQASTTVNSDGSSPVTIATLSPSPNGAGWHNANVTVGLVATDSGSGVREISYTVTRAQTISGSTTSGASVSIPVTDEGTSIISFYARDNAGNAEAPKTLTVRLDKTAPTLTFNPPAPAANAAGWHNTNVAIAFASADTLSGVATSAPASPLMLSTEGLAVTATATITDVAGNSATFTSPPVRIDKSAPVVTCASADGLWHAADVSIACTANGDVSGLANAADSTFALVTLVAANTESSNASTGTRTIVDIAGNSSIAGPISGNRVDKKAPDLVVTSPTNSGYRINQIVAASYACIDGGSGLAAGGCSGSVLSGAPIDTSSPGQKSITLRATDAVGNTVTRAVSYAVTYAIGALFDADKLHNSGATIPFKIQLLDGSGRNVSSENVVVTAVSISLLSSYVPTTPASPGSSNPDNIFRFAVSDYSYNLKTSKDLAPGTYVLIFTVANDPIGHTAQFKIR